MKAKNKISLYVLVAILLVTIFSLLIYYCNQRDPSKNKVNNYDCNINDIKEGAKYLKDFNEALYFMQLYCGQPESDIGSGMYIPQWRVSNNSTLTLSMQGLVYKRNNNEENIIETNNYLIDNIFGDYTVSYYDAENQQDIWMGTLRLSSDMRYRYYELSKFSHEIDQKTETLYLMANPVGDFNFKIQNNYNKTDRLELIKNNSTIAEITFTSGDEVFTQFLKVDTHNRRVYFHSTVSEISLVRLDKVWENRFYAPNIQRNEYEITVPNIFMDYDSHGTPISLDADKELLNDVQFYDSSENVIYSLYEVSKVSEPAYPDAESRNKYVENKMKVFLPQSVKNVRSEQIEIDGNIFLKITYDNYSIPEQEEFLGTDYMYGIELENNYIFFTHVSIEDAEMEKILETFQVLEGNISKSDKQLH